MSHIPDYMQKISPYYRIVNTDIILILDISAMLRYVKNSTLPKELKNEYINSLLESVFTNSDVYQEESLLGAGIDITDGSDLTDRLMTELISVASIKDTLLHDYFKDIGRVEVYETLQSSCYYDLRKFDGKRFAWIHIRIPEIEPTHPYLD